MLIPDVLPLENQDCSSSVRIVVGLEINNVPTGQSISSFKLIYNWLCAERSMWILELGMLHVFWSMSREEMFSVKESMGSTT